MHSDSFVVVFMKEPHTRLHLGKKSGVRRKRGSFKMNDALESVSCKGAFFGCQTGKVEANSSP